MIETQTSWEDSGYDCQLCGVKILKRTDHETKQPARQCFQGERGCQWSLEGELLRVGNHPECRKAHNRASGSVYTWRIPIWIQIVVGLFFLFSIVRFGGLAALRFLVPLFLLIVAGIFLFRYGRRQSWW